MKIPQWAPNALIAGRVQLDPGPPPESSDFRRIRLSPHSPTYQRDVATYCTAALQNAVEFGKRNGYGVAADLASFYLNNRNPKAVYTVSGRWLFSLPAAHQALETNLARFTKDVNKLAAELKPGQSARLQDHWDVQVLSSSYKPKQDLTMAPHYPALGSFTIQSHADLTISKDSQGRLTISGQVKSGVLDRYDWNNPTTITDFDTRISVELTPKDFQALEKQRLAAPFDVRSKPVVSIPTISGGRVLWRSVDESGQSLRGPTPNGGGTKSPPPGATLFSG
jgi:hypothetical protein